jgi:hypothetical protein
MRSSLFNSPIETGLRSLFVLNAVAPTMVDLQRLVAYDYLIVHSGDMPEGPSSLHPAVPYRGGEWLVRRDVVGRGLSLMYSRELIARDFSPLGIRYHATPLTTAFLAHLQSPYAEGLRIRAIWLAQRFSDLLDGQLSELMTANVGEWGAEFERQAAVRELEF